MPLEELNDEMIQDINDIEENSSESNTIIENDESVFEFHHEIEENKSNPERRDVHQSQKKKIWIQNVQLKKLPVHGLFTPTYIT